MNKTENVSKRKEIFTDWMIDLLLFTVVLNLFNEYTQTIFFESFTLSLFTAFVLKALLYSIIGIEHGVREFFFKKKGKIYRYAGIVLSLLILFLSKFVILEVIDLIFGTAVEIKGFVPLVILIITIMVSRIILEKIYKNL